jgi:hypothetical protein
MRDRLSLQVAAWPRICHGQARKVIATLLSLGYEPYDARLCCLELSLVTELASTDWRREVVSGPRISLVSRCSAASGLQIGLQDPVLDLRMSAGVCTAPETTAAIKRTSATPGRHLTSRR